MPLGCIVYLRNANLLPITVLVNYLALHNQHTRNAPYLISWTITLGEHLINQWDIIMCSVSPTILGYYVSLLFDNVNKLTTERNIIHSRNIFRKSTVLHSFTSLPFNN